VAAAPALWAIATDDGSTNPPSNMSTTSNSKKRTKQPGSGAPEHLPVAKSVSSHAKISAALKERVGR
jgi:hypothetical protein